MAWTNTFIDVKNRVAMVMGDCGATGGASGIACYDKFAEAEYEIAINFAIELVKESYLLPCTGDLTWIGDTYDYAPPTGMVYLYEVRGRRGATNVEGSKDRTPEVYEVEYPMDWISVQRTAAAPPVLKIHFDEESIKARNLNVTDLVLRCQGHKYQDPLVDSTDVLYVNWAIIVLLAKTFLNLGGSSRDWNDMLKHLRAWQATLQEASLYASDDFEVPGGIWLDQA